MADGRHFEKPLNCHISATVWPILMKFGTVTQIGPLQGSGDRPLKFRIFQKTGWRRLPSWKTTKIAISQQRIERSSRNLARLCKMGHLTAQTVKNFKFPKSKMAARGPRTAAIFKTVKSSYPRNRLIDFDEIWHDDADWPHTGDWPLKFRIFQIPRWRRPTSCKS